MRKKGITPGPWVVHHEMRDCVTFEGKYGPENLFLENVRGYFACQNEDDAHLISAAPELYESCEQMARAITLMLQDKAVPGLDEILLLGDIARRKSRGQP